MPSDLDNNTTTNVKPEMLSGVKTRNGIPHDKYNVCDISHVLTNRKDDIFTQRGLVQSVVRQRSDEKKSEVLLSQPQLNSNLNITLPN